MIRLAIKNNQTFGKSFFEEDRKRRQDRRQMDDKETPRVRVPR